jgi:hypothetical protein
VESWKIHERKQLRNKIPVLLAAAGLTIGLAACTSSGSSDSNGSTNAAASAEATNAGAGLDLIFTNQPAPIFATSAYRTQLSDIEAVEALGSPTYAFFMPPGWSGSGDHPINQCPAEGLPIPDTTQLDNPDEIVEDPYGGGYQENNGGLVEPRADPNGVYTPQSGEGTFVTCISSTGGLAAKYYEGDVFAQTGTARWDNATGEVQDVGPDQLPVCTIERATKANHKALDLNVGNSYDHCVKAPCPAQGATIACTTGMDTPTAMPEVRDGKIVMEPWKTAGPGGPIMLQCSLHNGTMVKDGKLQSLPVESTCGYPGGLSLTFAPWGVISAS